MSVIICRPDEFLRRRISYCPRCKTKRRFVGREAVYYGTTWHCCGCGTTWSDGERLRSTGTRDEAIAHAKRLWEQAGPFDRAAYELWLREQVGDLVETVEVSP